MKKVLVIGSTVADILIQPNQKPVMNLGGCAFNVCHVLHHLQVPYSFISTVGRGPYGEYVHTELNKLQIEHHVHSTKENGCCFCYIDEKGERSFKAQHGAEYTFNPHALDTLNLADYDYLYICGLEIAEQDGDTLVQCLKNYPGTLFFAPGPCISDIPKHLLETIFSMHCILHLNQEEAFLLSGKNTIHESASALFQKTKNTVILTCGEHGSYYFNKSLHFFPSKTCTVLNTNGAGDNHIGAILACLAHHKSLDFALPFANQLARAVVQSKTTHVDSYTSFLNMLR